MIFNPDNELVRETAYEVRDDDELGDPASRAPGRERSGDVGIGAVPILRQRLTGRASR